MQLERLPSIWIENPITIPYVSKGATIDRSRRFEFNSIYYKDDPTKPKKKIDEFMFPMKLLDDFRKNIKEATSKSKDRLTQRRSSSYDSEEGDKSTVSIKANKITNKLYRKPTPLKGQRDMFGVRASIHSKDFQEKCRIPLSNGSIIRNKSNEKLYITASQRINLSRPINFNPGPGAYLRESTDNIAKYSLGCSIHLNESVLKKKPREKIQLGTIQFRHKNNQ